MKYNIRSIPRFDKQVKALAKKYPSLKKDLKALFDELETNPMAGTLLFDEVYKIRMAISSKNKGKSGGARVIYLNLFALQENNDDIVMLSIYDKSEHETITDRQIKDALREV